MKTDYVAYGTDKMNYCSNCGKTISFNTPPGDDRPRFLCDSCGTIHYQNPLLVVGCIPEAGNKILLCRRAIEPCSGKWTLPAGYLELGETAEQGALREAWEEARARLELEGLLAVFSIVRISQIQLIYRARLTSPSIAPGPESAEVGLFAWDEIPWEDIAFPSVHWSLSRHREIGAGPLGLPGTNPESDTPGL